MDRVDVVVAGAGVVGLACARALALAGREVVVVEAEPRIGQGVSSRNSEVIHAGLYYPPGSLKARLCVRGRQLLYELCASHGVAHRRCGKLVVAARADDAGRLGQLRDRARACGVEDLQLLTRAQALALEPQLECAAALLSPSTGIVSAHELMTALLGDAEGAGAALAVASTVAGARRAGDAWRVRVRDEGGAGFELDARWLVNAAALDAQALAASIEGFPPGAVPRRHLARGHYFSLAGRSPFSRLVYPMPVDGGLGVHLTIDLGGRARFGPDVQWFTSDAPGRALDYAVDGARAASFVEAIRSYWPALPDGALQPAYTGVRPKISGPGETAADFRIDGPAEHGVAGIVNLFGIESPGLTASLAIGERVAAMVAAHA